MVGHEVNANGLADIEDISVVVQAVNDIVARGFDAINERGALILAVSDFSLSSFAIACDRYHLEVVRSNEYVDC